MCEEFRKRNLDNCERNPRVHPSVYKTWWYRNLNSAEFKQGTKRLSQRLKVCHETYRV